MKNHYDRCIYCLVKLFIISFILIHSNIIFGTSQPDLTKGYYSEAVAFQFSGTVHKGIKACPWLLNEVTSELTGLNEEFRAHFKSDLRNETKQYPILHFDNFTYYFSGSWHHWKNYRQDDLEYFTNASFPYKYNSSTFDPYYAVVGFRWNFSDGNSWDEWNNTVVPVLKERLATKWYIDKVGFSIIFPCSPSRTSFPSQFLIFCSLAWLFLWRSNKRVKRGKMNEYFQN